MWEANMSQTDTKIADTLLKSCRIFAYCPHCDTSQLINLEQYADYTINDLSYKVTCPECGGLGLDCLIFHN